MSGGGSNVQWGGPMFWAGGPISSTTQLLALYISLLLHYTNDGLLQGQYIGIAHHAMVTAFFLFVRLFFFFVFFITHRHNVR